MRRSSLGALHAKKLIHDGGRDFGEAEHLGAVMASHQLFCVSARVHGDKVVAHRSVDVGAHHEGELGGCVLRAREVLGAPGVARVCVLTEPAKHALRCVEHDLVAVGFRRSG